MQLFIILIVLKIVMNSVGKNRESEFEYYNQKYPKRNK